MAFKPFIKRRPDGGVPTDSFSDIAFLLIIFFIITTTLKNIVGFTTELPASQEQEKKPDTETPTVTLKVNQLTFMKAEMSIEDFKAKLASMKLADRKPSEKVVLLDATMETDYQNYYEVMAAISTAGGVVGIMTETK
ncbi:MAG: biopolymer transporter ExbD [Lentisphaerota bacterium]